ncbi:MAG TPA: (d)CMP kinase [Streptosporangiaceae bacterium]|nr:(d)CMP kinase [Streptosporangiaceae bacterium]
MAQAASEADRWPERGLIVAVDGPSGSGKSSAARGAAAVLGLRYLDTGAMYRAVTWWMLEHRVDLSDAAEVVRQGTCLTIEVCTDPALQRTIVDGADVTTAIRDRAVSNAVSVVASIPGIRAHLIGLQQDIIARAAAAGGVVAEGRDIGTVVAPQAPLKVFLTASEQARAERRSAELGAAADAGADLTRREQARRDRLDAPQTRQAGDAVEIDATDLSLAEVIDLIVGLARAKRVRS